MANSVRALALILSGLLGAVLWGTVCPQQSAASGALRFSPKSALLTYDLQNGTDAGTNTGATWTTRALNTEVYDPDNIVTLAANRFTLKPGRYFVDARQTFFGAHGIPKSFRARLRNMTDNLTAGVSLNVRLHEELNESACIDCPIPPIYLDLDQNTAFELQYYSESADTNSWALGLGFVGTNEVERYAAVFIQKLD